MNLFINLYGAHLKAESVQNKQKLNQTGLRAKRNQLPIKVGECTRKLFQEDVCVSPDIVLSGCTTISILEVTELQFTVRMRIFEGGRE